MWLFIGLLLLPICSEGSEAQCPVPEGCVWFHLAVFDSQTKKTHCFSTNRFLVIITNCAVDVQSSAILRFQELFFGLSYGCDVVGHLEMQCDMFCLLETAQRLLMNNGCLPCIRA